MLICWVESAPKWVMKMIGAQEEAYVREITFVNLPSSSSTNDVVTTSKPGTTKQPTPQPEVLQASINLSLATLVKCIERISYRPATRNPDSFTTFRQRAEFYAQGRLTVGKIGKALGKKIEEQSWDRFDSNAGVGRAGFSSVLQRMWGREKIGV